MKLLPKLIITSSVVFTIGNAAACAQSVAPATHVSNAVGHSAAASEEVVRATGESGKVLVKVAAGVVAVPVFASGAALAGSGAVSSALGEAGTVSGEATTSGAQKIWDFATGDPAKRPALDRKRTLPSVKKPQPPAADPAPAQVLSSKR